MEGALGDGPAQRALRLVTADPRQAGRLAVEARREARRAGDRDAESTAERALGLAARELNDSGTALRHLRRAVRVARAAGLAQRTAEARMSLALVLAEVGRPGQALRELDEAAPALDGLPAARLGMQRALTLDRLSRFAEAMDGYTGAIAAFRRAGDQLWQARALTNRGVLHAYRGSLRQAEADLFAAERLYDDLGQHLAVAQVRHNLGFVAAQAGDVPGALRWYDVADEYFARNGRPAIALMDRGELLLRARLLPEARDVAQAALEAARAGRTRLYEAQARLMLAEVAIGGGDRRTARRHASAAYRAFVRQGRPAWAALARYTALRAADETAPARRLRRAREVAAELAAAGWPTPALDARLYAAGLAAGRAEGAEELRLVLAAGRNGPAELRVRAWHAAALLRDAVGDAAGARRALLAGARILDTYRAALGATELRTLAASYATDLAATGLRLARQTGRARSVLWWAERWKAAALRLPPARPPHEPALAADLAELRRAVAEADSGVAAGRVNALWRQRRALEERIRRRSWHARGSGSASRSPNLLARLGGELADRTLFELIDIGGELHVIVVHRGRFRSRPLGRTDRVVAELEALRFALRRIVLRHGGPASRSAAVQGARHAAEQLDRALFAPVRGWLGDGELVVVPVGLLHATPWALLPTCRGRAVSVAPSATAWLDATARAAGASPGGRPLLVAGPGLTHVDREVRRLADALAPAEVFVGAAAGAEPVLAALDGAPLAHVAAHGGFRSDNPMFSYLRLADGPITVYDLEQVARPPAVVVLSACESGLSTVHPGDELMGLAAALLGVGTATVLGSVLPAQDEATLELMLDLHRRLAGGSGAAAALAAAQAAMNGTLDERSATAAAFVCFGAG
ncbi:CHAT domain-containing protein [Polymorphospora sp. NPDC050346]|uniref:CHAT domain-containing protein n=1 Tax=Polymorphospora sp. NPDC050346 TaxID=3155780 RepID=UPI003406C245